MKDLETMQREGREFMHREYNHIWPLKPHHFGQTDFKDSQTFAKDLDQHTANTWKAAQESTKKQILESGLLEEEKDCDNCNDCEAMMSCPRKEAHNTLARAVKELICNMDKV